MQPSMRRFASTSRKIIRLTEARGIEFKTLAEAVGSTPGRISKLTTNTVKPDIHEILRIARFFGVSMEFLCDNDLKDDPVRPLSPSRRKVLAAVDLLGDRVALRRLLRRKPGGQEPAPAVPDEAVAAAATAVVEEAAPIPEPEAEPGPESIPAPPRAARKARPRRGPGPAYRAMRTRRPSRGRPAVPMADAGEAPGQDYRPLPPTPLPPRPKDEPDRAAKSRAKANTGRKKTGRARMGRPGVGGGEVGGPAGMVAD